MNLHKTNLFALLFTLFQSIVSGHWTCQSEDIFRYNICHDPVHPNTTFSNAKRRCNIGRGFKRQLISTTNNLVDHLQNEKVNFENEHIRCDFCVQQLQRGTIARIIDIETPHEIESETSVTNIYIKMAKFLRLFHKLWCLYATKAEVECSLPFSNIFRRLKHQVLHKWWIVQNSCGQAIEDGQCDFMTPSFPSPDLRCADIRNVIYMLLRDAHNLMEQSHIVALEI